MTVRSITATRLRAFAAAMAPFCPAGPLPITTRSYSAAVTLRASISTSGSMADSENQRRDVRLTKSVIRITPGIRLKRIRRIDHVLLMIYGEYPSSVDLYFNGRLIAVRKPKTINSLVLPYKIGSIDPEGRFLCRVANDFHNREVDRIDPYFPLE